MEIRKKERTQARAQVYIIIYILCYKIDIFVVNRLNKFAKCLLKAGDSNIARVQCQKAGNILTIASYVEILLLIPRTSCDRVNHHDLVGVLKLIKLCISLSVILISLFNRRGNYYNATTQLSCCATQTPCGNLRQQFKYHT